MIIVAKSLYDIFGMRCFAGTSHSKIAHYHYRYVKLMLREYLPFKHLISNKGYRAVEFGTRQQHQFRYQSFKCHLKIIYCYYSIFISGIRACTGFMVCRRSSIRRMFTQRESSVTFPISMFLRAFERNCAKNLSSILG